MNGKTYKKSSIAVTIATTLAVGGALAPAQVNAKASTDAIVGTGKGKITRNAIIGTGANAIIGTGADAIIGTGADAIIGTGTDAIIGTGKGKITRNAIIGTGANAIIGTGADAIIGTGANAIIGTGADAIIGTGADAIIGTGANAIIGTGADAIIGTGANAIIGTGADAIIGTGADAIIGTGKSKHSRNAIIGTGKDMVLVMGAVDGVDTATNTISVLGRSLKMPSVAKVEESLAAGHQLMVAVSGHISDSGTVEQMKLRFMPTDYVAGSSKVVVSGRVSDLDAKVGTMKVGGITVDISSAVAARPPTAGSLVLIVGTQPVRQGIVLAEQLHVK